MFHIDIDTNRYLYIPEPGALRWTPEFKEADQIINCV